ncbi:MAG: HEPN domain-containing protein [Candidatus Asgardarchaeum sp.]
MSSNLDRFSDWVAMAISDLKTALLLYKNRVKAATIFHAQQFAEKICKALMVFFGMTPQMTHFPSKILSKIIDERFMDHKVEEEEKELIDRITSLSSTLEDEKARPRYGVLHADRLIPPDEYYSYLEVQLYINDAFEIAKGFVKLMRIKSMSEKLSDLILELEDLIDEYEHIRAEEKDQAEH